MKPETGNAKQEAGERPPELQPATWNLDLKPPAAHVCLLFATWRRARLVGGFFQVFTGGNIRRRAHEGGNRQFEIDRRQIRREGFRTAGNRQGQQADPYCFISYHIVSIVNKRVSPYYHQN